MMFVTDGYITSLCFHPTGSHLTVGFDTGEAKSFEGLPSSPHLIASLSKPEVLIITGAYDNKYGLSMACIHAAESLNLIVYSYSNSITMLLQ